MPILLYHYIGDCPPDHDDPYRPDLWVTEARFADQLSYLSAHGYHTVDLQAVLEAARGGSSLDPGALVLTFDDGTCDNYERAFPLLRRAGCVATFFVVTDLVGTPGHMTWDQLREMAVSGMSIESHTATHADLNTLTRADLERELREPRAALERELGRPGSFLAYPGGHYNAAVCAATESAGYDGAVTTLEGISFGSRSLFEMPRVRVSSTDLLPQFAARLATDYPLSYELKRLLRRYKLWKRWKTVRKRTRRLVGSVPRPLVAEPRSK